MSSLPLPVPPLPTPHHASEEEYAAFVLKYHGNLGAQRYYLQLRRAFVEAYPDLTIWFAAPLVERVGRLRRHPRSELIGRVSYRARPYLFFLALRGYATFDWEWLIAISNIHIWEMLPFANHSLDLEQLIEEAVKLGYNRLSSFQDLCWVVSRICLHTGQWQTEALTEAACDELAAAVRAFGEREDIASSHGSIDEYRRRARKAYLTAIHRLKVVLYHRGRATTEPWKVMPKYAAPSPGPPQMLAMIARYLAARSVTSRPATITRLEVSFRRFMQWVSRTYPHIDTWASITRDHLLEFAVWLSSWKGMHSGRPLSILMIRGNLSALSVFFRDTANWGWEDVPGRPLLAAGDYPKLSVRIPRYVPEDELSRIMTAIRVLPCPYQRAALLIARWSGARRDEIRRLALDCLDAYPDGTPRLRIPAGKTKQERMIP